MARAGQCARPLSLKFDKELFLSLKFDKELFFGFVTGHDFGRAVTSAKSMGFSP
jgi:hypothetical protein